MTLNQRLFAGLKAKYATANRLYQDREEMRCIQRAAFRRMQRLVAAQYYLNHRNLRDHNERLASF